MLVHFEHGFRKGYGCLNFPTLWKNEEGHNQKVLTAIMEKMEVTSMSTNYTGGCDASDEFTMISIVSKCTVLGSFLLLLYINDIEQQVCTDDCFLLRHVDPDSDVIALQQHPDNVIHWSEL